MTQAMKITRTAIVIDRSGSMGRFSDAVVKVVDDHVKFLAQQAEELKQEIRVTIVAFGSTVETLIFDTGVQWLPSIKDLYRTSGNTAMIDGTLKAIKDLKDQDRLSRLAKVYGELNYHVLVVTDGAENYSTGTADSLARTISNLGENWTVGCMVPNYQGRILAGRYGFPPGNVTTWDATSAQGVEEAGRVLRGSTQTYLTNINRGVRSSRTLFAGGTDQVNEQTVAGLKALETSKYVLIPVANPGDRLTTYTYAARRDPKQRKCVLINEFIEMANHRYVTGSTFYELTDMSQVVQANKMIAVVDEQTSKVYLGDQARRLLELPDTKVRLKKLPNSRYSIFIASHATNRLLPIGTRVLLLV